MLSNIKNHKLSYITNHLSQVIYQKSSINA